jgi:hypothetical protein
MQPWIDHPWHGLDNYKIDSLQLADGLRKLLPELYFGLVHNCWIKTESHIFGTVFYRDNSKCIKFLLTHLPFQANLHSERLGLADSVGCRIYSEMNTDHWWCDTHNQIPARGTIVAVICASNRTYLTNFSGN